MEVLPEDMDYAVRSYAYACIGLTFKWLQGELDYTPDQFARLQYRFMPDRLKETSDQSNRPSSRMEYVTSPSAYSTITVKS